MGIIGKQVSFLVKLREEKKPGETNPVAALIAAARGGSSMGGGAGTVQFPNRCTWCGLRAPAAGLTRTLVSVQSSANVSVTYKLEAPVCEPCKKSVRASELRGCAGMLLVVGGFIFASWLELAFLGLEEWVLKNPSGGVNWLILSLQVLYPLALAAYVYFWMRRRRLGILRRPALEMVGRFQFRLRDDEYCRLFCSLNHRRIQSVTPMKRRTVFSSPISSPWFEDTKTAYYWTQDESGAVQGPWSHEHTDTRASNKIPVSVANERGMVVSEAVERPSQTASGADTAKPGERYHESDNMGTRHDTEEQATMWWAANLGKDKGPFIVGTFPTREAARSALLEMSCMHEVGDAGAIISTETLVYGFYQQADGVWEVEVVGRDLSHELWRETREAFLKHGGTIKNEEVPEAGEQGESKVAAVDGGVAFVREERKVSSFGTMTYRIYSAPGAETAKQFLKENPVTRPLHYLVVETPEGNYGRDQDGIYAEQEKTEFDVVLTGFGDDKIRVLKAVREVTGLDIQEAKALVESLPKPVKEAVSKFTAEEVKKQLEAAGASVQLR